MYPGVGFSQNPDWFLTFGGSGRDNGFAIYVDDNEYIYATGRFEGTVDFDPGPEVLNMTSNNGWDIFVLKLNPKCGLEWVRTFGGNGSDEGHDILADEKGNVYVTGFFWDLVDFGPGSGIVEKKSNGQADIFALKLLPTGALEWVQTFGGKQWDCGEDIQVDESGNVYVTGMFKLETDFDPGPGTLIKYANGPYSQDIFVLKLTPTGALGWVQTFGGGHKDEGGSIQIDMKGNVYMTGYFSITLDFDPGPEVENRTSNGWEDVFVLKLDPNGSLDWVQTFGGGGGDGGSSIHIDEKGNVYLTGSITGPVILSSGAIIGTDGSQDIFVMKLTPEGSLDWVQTFGDSARDQGKSIFVDNSGNIFVTGSFSSTVAFGPDPGMVKSTPNEIWHDVFVLKLTPSGHPIWVQAFGGNGRDEGSSIYVDKEGTVYVTGSIESSFDFNLGTGEMSHITSNGEWDAFILKLAPSGKIPTKGPFAKLYPNPTSGKISLEGDFDEVIIWDTLGRELKRFNTPEAIMEIDLGIYADGVFFLQLKKCRTSETRKIVLQKL